MTYNSGVEYHPRQPERKKSNGLFRRLMLLFAAAGIIVLGFVADTRKSRSFPASVAQLSVQEISDFDFDQMTGTAEDVPARLRNLDGKRIVLVGRMWAPHASNGRIDSFQLAPSHLSEFKPPLPQEFIACRVDTPVILFRWRCAGCGYGAHQSRSRRVHRDDSLGVFARCGPGQTGESKGSTGRLRQASFLLAYLLICRRLCGLLVICLFHRPEISIGINLIRIVPQHAGDLR